eukprot:CAMPEP_0168212712 /NCGR_PEP_ID=MMETSP0140_2-20121125/4412_1 /TAXON_ID=44445 /ORGANISM="Pseudo-nitzschia australis, Strain 10249 10 AB" /LENGTH=488 /DNA_ID=CAMNT_0008139523 /DNA_START=86 /DNA_END=1553 /DNA_ORIENTATION=+
MTCTFTKITSRKRGRMLPPTAAWPLLLVLFYRSTEDFVCSFQVARSKFSFKSSCDTNFNKHSSVRKHPIRLDGLLSRFATTEDCSTADVKSDDSFNTNAEKLSTDEIVMDALRSNGTRSESAPALFSEPDYCCVDCDDISAPFLSREDSESTFLQYTEDGLILPAGPIGQLKEGTANFLTEPSIEIVIALVVLMNSLLVALSTVDSLSSFLPYIRTGEIIIGTIFLADFVARWFSSSRNELGFILDPQFVADILVVILPLAVIITPAEVTILPSALSQPSGLFNLQLLRVLRLQRFLQDLDTFDKFMERAMGRSNANTYVVQDWQLQLARVVLSLFTLISVATGLIYTAEHTVNPNINNYFDALYFGLTTLTTVGFGDVSPVTTQGRIIVCGSILFGVAVVPAQAGALLEALLDRENIRKGRAQSFRTKMQEATASSNTKQNYSKLSASDGGDETNLALNTTILAVGVVHHFTGLAHGIVIGAEKKYK